MLSRPVDPHVACKPALDRKKRPHVGQGTVGALSVADAALALRVAIFIWASDVCLCSAERALEETALRQAQVLALMLSSLTEALRVSL